MKTSLVAAMVLALGSDIAEAQSPSNDTGAWYQEQVRRNQANGTIGINPVIPPTVTTPRSYYQDEIYQRQHGTLPSGPRAPAPNLAVPAPTLPPAPVMPQVAPSSTLRATVHRSSSDRAHRPGRPSTRGKSSDDPG